MTNRASFDREDADASNDVALGFLASSDRSRIDLLRSLVEVVDNASFTADGATSLTGWLRRRGAMTALEAGRTTRRVNVLRRLSLTDDGPMANRLAEHLTCEASIRRLVVDPNGNPLNLGRSAAVVSSSQRHTLVIRDQGCVLARKPTRLWRVVRYEQLGERNNAHDGETEFDNLVLLCRHHHRLVHGNEWGIARDPVTGTVLATRSDGRKYTRLGSGRQPTSRDGPNGTDPPD
jgi:hypothetical protein